MFRAVIFVVSVAVVSGLMCQWPHCEQQTCDPVGPCKDGVVKMGGGFCGCCLACFVTVGENDTCQYKDVVDAIVYPATRVCDSGLYCDQTTQMCLKGMPSPFG